MNVLVDTQSIIWFAENSPQLSQTARNTIESPDNECFVSMATFWEGSIKMGLGKLDIKGMPLSDFWDEIIENNFLVLDIRREHILQYEKLALHLPDKRQGYNNATKSPDAPKFQNAF
jgi:PIN domain nuclease of toxin-antitoxin system